MAIIPAPVWAAPTASDFTVTNGSVTLSPSSGISTFNASNRAVLVWNAGKFNIGSTENWTFNLPAGGAVLNKVGYTATGGLAAKDNAVIDGTLFSNGSVFVLANGNISVGAGAHLQTTGGLVVLSTLQVNDDFAFTSSFGNATVNLTGAATGDITLNSLEVAGSLNAYAGQFLTQIPGGNVSGDLLLKAVTANSGITLANTGALSVSGNLSVMTNNGAIGQTNRVSVAGNETRLSTGGNAAITLGNTQNDFQTVFANTVGTGGNVTITDNNVVVLGASSIGQDLVVVSQGAGTAGGAAGNVAISNNGTLTVGGNASFSQTATANANITIGENSTIGGLLNATTHNNSTFTFNGVGNVRIGAISSSGGSSGNRSGVSVTTNGTITVDATTGQITLAGGNNTAGGNITLTGANIVQDGPVTTTKGGVVTFNATSGGITLNNNINVAASGNGSVNLRTAGGAIQQLGGIITTGNKAATPTFNATTSGTITLDRANNFVDGQVLQVTAGTATLNLTGSTGSVAIGTSNVSGGLTVIADSGTTPNVILGAGAGSSGQDLVVGGGLTVRVAGTATITDNDYSAFNIFGPVTLNSTGTGAITLDAARANGALAPSVRLGQVNVNAVNSAVTVAETTTLNLGTITATSLSAYSTGENIINSGTITTSTSTSAQVGANGTINLTGSSNNFTSLTLSGGTDVSAHSGAASLIVNVSSPAPGNATFTSNAGSNLILGSINAGNLTVNSGGTIDIQGGVIANNATLTAGASVAATTIDDTTVTANIIESGLTLVGGVSTGTIPGNLTVSGTTTINSPALLQGKNDFGSVVLGNVAGPVTIHDINNLSVSGNASDAVTLVAGANSTFAPAPIASEWSLVLGNLNISGANGSLNATASTGGGGNSGSISQASGTSLHVENTLTATTTNGNIVIGNNGNSAGRVALFAGSGGSGGRVTYVEDGTVKLGNITARNNANITSRFGSIIEDPTANDVITVNGTITLNATAGSVTIGNTSHTDTTTTTGNIVTAVINAPIGAASITSNNNLTLGNINVNSLVVTATNNITQNQPVRVFGAASFTAGRNIVLSNNSNNFGPVSLATTGISDAPSETIRGNITVNEAGTLNLRSVSMGTLGSSSTSATAGNATFTATSVNGDIVDSGLGGVKLGGLVAPSTAQNAGSILRGSGVVTLTATKGNIVIDDPTSDVLSTAGVAFNGNDVTLAVLGSAGSVLPLGAANVTSTATGNLTASSALGNIGNLGAFKVGGLASFQTGNGNITINQPNIGFGQLRFTGNQVSIQEAGNMDIVTGSSAFGNAQLAAGGSITIVPGVGTVTFGGNVSMQAVGDITLRQMQAVGNLTVSHTGTANLSALSKATDLNNHDPIDAGTGPYVGPNP